MNNIGMNIKQIRAEKKMTQKSLANLSGVDQATISNIENGRYTPSLPTVISIATAFQTSVANIDPRLLGVDRSSPDYHLADDSTPYQAAPSPDSLKRIIDERWDSLSPVQKVRMIEILDEDQ